MSPEPKPKKPNHTQTSPHNLPTFAQPPIPSQVCPPSNLDVSSTPLSTAAWESAATFSIARLMCGIITSIESTAITPEITKARFIRCATHGEHTKDPLQSNNLNLQLLNCKRQHMIRNGKSKHPLRQFLLKGLACYQSRKKITTPPPMTRTIQMKILANNLPKLPWT